MRRLFPFEYAKLDPNTLLTQANLLEIDRQLLELLNSQCFPCYGECQCLSYEVDGEDYSGIRELEIVTIGYDPYSYWERENCYDYVYDRVAMHLQEFPSWYMVLEVEEVVRCFDAHPIQRLPEVLAYVFGLTGNVWLDTLFGESGSEAVDLQNINDLTVSYQQAVAHSVTMQFFDAWFQDNFAVASRLIDKIIELVFEL